MSTFHKHRQFWMILMTALVSLVFILYWNGPTGNRGNRMPQVSDDYAKIYGDTVTKTMFRRELQKARLALQLKLELYPELAQSYSESERAANNFAWNSLILQHEADKLQLEPTNQTAHTDVSVLEAIKHAPGLQTVDGQFDPKQYNDLVDSLPSMGFTADDLETLVAEDLRMKKIKDLLQSTFVVPAGDYRQLYTQLNQKMDTSVIHFKLADFEAKVQVSEDDIRKTFEQHLEGYHSKEKRGIKYVTFTLSDADKKLDGKERAAALQKVSDSVEAFTGALQANGGKFEDAATKLNLTVTTIPPFALTEPDPKIPQDPGFANNVFALTPENPITEPLEERSTDSYYMIKLDNVVPSKILTLEEARTQVVEEIKATRAAEAMNAQAADVHKKIAADMSAGKSFADAAKAAAQAVEIYPPFSRAESEDLQKKTDGEQVAYAAINLKPGELGQVQPATDGAILVYLDKIEPIDETAYETARKRQEPQYNAQQLTLVFQEWLRQHHDAAKIDIVGENRATPVPQPPK